MILLRLLNPVAAILSYINYKVDRLRLAKLVSRGLKVGRNVAIVEGVEFDTGYPFLIEIGDNCTISKGVRILAHDASASRSSGVTRIAPVKILEDTLISERAIILPGVTIGPRALVTAGSVVNRDVGEDAMVAGSPARFYSKRSDFLRKHAEKVRTGTVVERRKGESDIVRKANLLRALEKTSVVFATCTPEEDPYFVNADYKELCERVSQSHQRVRSQPPSAETPSTKSTNENG